MQAKAEVISNSVCVHMRHGLCWNEASKHHLEGCIICNNGNCKDIVLTEEQSTEVGCSTNTNEEEEVKEDET